MQYRDYRSGFKKLDDSVWFRSVCEETNLSLFATKVASLNLSELKALNAKFVALYNEERHCALMDIQRSMLYLIARQDLFTIEKMDQAIEHFQRELMYRGKSAYLVGMMSDVKHDPSHAIYAEQLVTAAIADLHCCVGNLACNNECFIDTHERLSIILTKEVGDASIHGLSMNDRHFCALNVACDLFKRSEFIRLNHKDIDPSMFQVRANPEHEPWAWLVDFGRITSGNKVERTGFLALTNGTVALNR